MRFTDPYAAFSPRRERAFTQRPRFIAAISAALQAADPSMTEGEAKEEAKALWKVRNRKES